MENASAVTTTCRDTITLDVRGLTVGFRRLKLTAVGTFSGLRPRNNDF
jgi:hypothetical protein